MRLYFFYCLLFAALMIPRNLFSQRNAATDSLLSATQKGEYKKAVLAIQMGANVNYSDDETPGPLNFACFKGDVAIVKLLLEKGADLEKKSLEIPLTEEGSDMDVEMTEVFTPLMTAVNWKQEAATRFLLDKGANVNAGSTQGTSPLDLACRNGDVALAKLLIEKGAEVNPTRDPNDWAPLEYAIYSDNAAIVHLLLEKGAKLKNTTSEFDPFQYVKSVEVARILVDKGADIHAINKSGFTPFLTVCQGRKAEIARLLLEKGANPREKNG